MLVPLQKQSGRIHVSGLHGFAGSPVACDNSAANKTANQVAILVGDIIAL